MQRRKNTKSWASPLSNLQAGSPAVIGVVMPASVVTVGPYTFKAGVEPKPGERGRGLL